tara:strand:- start:95 stop:886 length:792 start_codon:yes stop_codon:yes gene_type:complete
MDKKLICKGKLYCYTEQGMEGGQLAFSDLSYIKLHSPKYGFQENEEVWDNKDKNKKGITFNPETFLNGSWLPSRDPILDEPDYQISSLFCGEEKGDFNADRRLMKKYNFRMKYTKERADETYGTGNWKFKKNNSEIVLNNGNVVIMGGTPYCEPNRPYHLPLAEFSRVTVNWNDGTTESQRKSDTLLIERGSYEGLQILEETDYLKIINLDTHEIICEGQINLIPLKTFSHTLEGHFENINDGNDWKEYFTNGHYGELYRETK